MAIIDTNKDAEREHPYHEVESTPVRWEPTEENFIYQWGEGRGAKYKVDFGDGEVYDAGEGDEAFVQAMTTRDMAVRNRMGRSVVTEAPVLLTPPEKDDRVTVSGCRLLSFVEDTPNAIVWVPSTNDTDGYQIEMPYDLLTKDEVE